MFIMYFAKNVIIVSFLDILSHVTNRSVQWCQKPVVLSNYLKYFMCNPEPFNSLEQSTTQSFTIVYIIEPHETQQHTLDLPVPSSSIQWPMMMKYASTFKACHALLVQLFLPLHNTPLYKRWMGWTTETKINSHILMIFELVSCDLNISIISLNMVSQFRITTPLVTCISMSIIFLNERCSEAWIGWVIVHGMSN